MAGVAAFKPNKSNIKAHYQAYTVYTKEGIHDL